MAALWTGRTRRIAVSAVGADAIALNPQTLEAGEDKMVLDALRRRADAGAGAGRDAGLTASLSYSTRGGLEHVEMLW